MTMKKVINEIGRISNDSYRTSDTKNAENFPAWKMSSQSRLEQFAMTGTLTNSFYSSSNKLVQDAVEVFEKADAGELSQAIIKGRNEGFIRTANIVGLVILSEKDSKLFKNVFTKVIRTGGDLEDFINLTHARRGFGRAIKTAIHNWLDTKTSPYYALKYRRQLADAIRISRYKGEDSLFKFILRHYKKDINADKVFDEYPKIKGYKDAVSAIKENDWKTVCSLIDTHTLDVSSLIGVGKIPSEAWVSLGRQMPVMMFLKYLNKLSDEGVFKKDKNLYKLKLTVDNLQKAKVFPFRLYVAYRNIKNTSVKNHLAKVLNDYVEQYDWSVFNKHSWVVAPDMSYSMNGEVSGSSLTPAVVAGMFSGFFYKGLDDVEMLPWDTTLRLKGVLPKSDSVISHINSIANVCGGGTNMEIPLRHMIENKIKVDNFMLITDSEEWGEGWLNYWKQYKKTVNPKTKAFMLRVDSNGTQPFSDAMADKLDIYQIFGWSDNVVKFIECLLK